MSGRQSYTSAAPQHFPEAFFVFVCISDSLLCMSAHVFACRPNVSPGGNWVPLYECPSVESPTIWGL